MGLPVYNWASIPYGCDASQLWTSGPCALGKASICSDLAICHLKPGYCLLWRRGEGANAIFIFLESIAVTGASKMSPAVTGRAGNPCTEQVDRLEGLQPGDLGHIQHDYLGSTGNHR